MTAAALYWLREDTEREGLALARPTILDFGQLPSSPLPRKPLVPDPPPPVEAARNGADVRETGLPAVPPPNSFDASFSRVTVLDAARFRAIRDRQPVVIHLAGITGIAFSEICDGVAGRWNCGARARAELARLIGPKAVGCIDLTTSGDDGEVRADCWVGNRSLSLFMVSRGWAEPIDPADPLLAPYAVRAKAEKLGRYSDGGLQPPDSASN